jgi:hypothetical protein
MNTQALISDLRKEMPVVQASASRVDYLKGRMTDLILQAWQLMEAHEDFVRRNRLVETILAQERLDAVLKEILKLQGEIHSLRGSGRPESDEITPEMIETARAYPFGQLYEFKRNVALCPFHEDHDPSFVRMKDNRARCFGACSKTWDTIAFVRDREGLSFPEAVRRLQ